MYTHIGIFKPNYRGECFNTWASNPNGGGGGCYKVKTPYMTRLICGNVKNYLKIVIKLIFQNSFDIVIVTRKRLK